jgi:hypothetical protein
MGVEDLRLATAGGMTSRFDAAGGIRHPREIYRGKVERLGPFPRRPGREIKYWQQVSCGVLYKNNRTRFTTCRQQGQQSCARPLI